MSDPDDPNGLIGQVIAMGSEFPGPAGDVLLSWLLALKEPEADPAAAATRLIERYRLSGPPFPPGPLGELVRMLHETMHYSPERLKDVKNERRGGRRGRPKRG